MYPCAFWSEICFLGQVKTARVRNAAKELGPCAEPAADIRCGSAGGNASGSGGGAAVDRDDRGLSVTIQNAVTKALLWAEDQFSNNPQIVAWLENLTIDWRSIDWESILTSVADFLRNGAGDVLNSTISAAKSMVSVLTSSFIAFVFACYILLQKEKWGCSAGRLSLRCCPRKLRSGLFPYAVSAIGYFPALSPGSAWRQ